MDLVRIRKNITVVAVTLTGILSLCGCSEDVWERGDDFHDGDVVNFTAGYPSFAGASGLTRAVTIPEKTEFQRDDAIHVSAVFTIQETSAQGTSAKATKTVYDCFVYKDGRWVSTSAIGQVAADDVMKWPWNAISGKFTAYYMPGSSGSLAVGSNISCRLDGQYTNCDLLYAETEEVPFGHTVNFMFRHLCTRLVLTEVKSGYVDKFGLQIKTSPTGGGADIAGEYKQMNACILTRNEDNTLDAEFVQSPNTDGSVSVVSAATDGQVLVFYLQPGNYSGAEICYANNRPYLELNVDGLKDCQAGYSYEINVSHTPGVVKKEEDDPWVEPGKKDLDFDIDIEAFLNSIQKGMTYSQEDPKTKEPVQITKYDDLGHIELLYNLDFRGEQFASKSLPASCYLHGNYHYIKRLSNSLFDNLNGTLDNLELRDVAIDLPNGNLRRMGALASSSHGNVSNVRLNGCRITGYVPEISTDVLAVGALIGEQYEGTVDNVTLMGDITVTATNELENGTARQACNGTVDLGGIIGQTGGIIKNVTMQAGTDGNAPVLTVVNNTQGLGIVSTGGLVGLSGGTINDCIISCTVDARSCKAQQNCVGGMVGRIRGGNLKDCTISGTVSGGTTEWGGGELNGYSLTGGICGYFVENPVVENCYAFCTVAECKHETSNRIVFGTGGGMGMIDSKSSSIRSCRVIGTVTGDNTTTGSFVGLCRGITADLLQSNENQVSDSENHKFCGQEMQ